MFKFKNEVRWNNVRLGGQLIKKKKKRFVYLGSVVLENVANVEDVKFVELVAVR